MFIIGWLILAFVVITIKRKKSQAAAIPAPVENVKEQEKEAARQAKEAEKAAREEEKARKAEQARQLAIEQIEHLRFLKDLYQRQAQDLEGEQINDTTNEKRRAQINTKLLQLDEKIYKTDLQIAKLFYKIN